MSFKGINLSENMLKSLNRQKYFSPSDIQLRCIPKALRRETLMVQSATGSGKTLCYLVPIIERIDLKNQSTQALIVAPTRELAQQIYDFAVPFIEEFKGLKIRLFKAGEEREVSKKGLSIAPHIVIGTPGRLADILCDSSLSLKDVKIVVFDEADMLLKEGYFEEIDKFVFKTNNPQFLVFSATLEANLSHQLEKYVGPNTPIVNEEVLTSSNVKHYLIDIRHQDVFVSLEETIKAINPYLLLVFASKKEMANEIYKYLNAKKYKVGLLTGDLSTRERKNVMKQVKNENIYILVCSDVAARGLDIQDVTDIINIDFPSNLEFYYHRAGRTGRFDKKGSCYTFYNNDKTERAMRLIEDGVSFTYLALSNGKLVEGHPLKKSHPTRRKKDEELEKEIRRINAMSNAKNKKVKPGYKKARKQEIAKAKQKRRREIIKQDIRRQRVERYKKEGRNNG